MVYPGSLNWHQGLDVAIRAFGKIAGRYPQAEFLIYGEGGEIGALMELAGELNLTDRIRSPGRSPCKKSPP